MRMVIAVVGLAVLGSVSPVLAQQSGFRTSQAQQEQLDYIQARLDGPQELLPMRAYVDYATYTSGRTLTVEGWAFTCDIDGPWSWVIFVDGIPSSQKDPSNFTMLPRPDVTAVGVTYCAPYAPSNMPGWHTLVDMTQFGNGPAGDGWHDLWIRIYNHLGQKYDSPKVRTWLPLATPPPPNR